MAGPRDLKITIDADSAKAEAGIQRLTRATMRMETQLRQADLAAAQLDHQLESEASRAAQQRADSMEKLGRGLVVFGAATVAGLGLAAKASINWESAWAGVRKTVDGSDAEMAALESELRNLTTTLPATHAEIAGVAEAAGQLGVGVNDVAEFTKVMVDLGETTNLSAAEAATALARIANIMGTATSDVDRMGATIVELGNNSATTEAEIVTLATRLAAAGKMAGLSEADVFAFASTLTSVGVEAEAGGTALSKVFTAVSDAVIDSNEDLEVFAEVAGMTASEFQAAFERDAAGAIETFISGLGRMQTSGQSTSAVFDELGLADQRLMRALLSTASAGGLLGDQIDMANRAWDENTALVKEAEQRYETSEAKIQIARNALVDLAIDVGGVLLPPLVKMVETGTSMLRFFSDLPGPVKTVATILATFAGIASLAAGGLLLLAPRIKAAHEAMMLLARHHRLAAGALIAFGQAAAGITALGAVAVGVYAVLQATKEAAPSIEDATQALLNFDDASKRVALDQLIRQMDDVQKITDRSVWDQLTSAIGGFGVANVAAGRDAEEFNDTLKVFDQSIASMVQSGNMDVARESAQRLFSEMGQTGDFDKLVEKILPEYADALLNVDNQQKIAGESAGPLNDAMADLATRFSLTGEDAEKAAEEMLDSWGEAIGEFVSITGAYDEALAAKEESERETAEATAAATEDSSDSWEDYVGDVTLTVDDYLAELERMVAAQENWRGNMVMLAGRVPDEMLDHLARLGPEGAAEVELLASMSDAELKQAVKLWRRSTDQGAQAIVDELAAAGPILRGIAAQHGQDVANNVAAYMRANKVGVAQAAAALGVAIDTNIPDSHNTKTTVTPPSPSNVAAVLKKIRDHFSGVTVPLRFGDPGFGVLSGGGSGMGGGLSSGGWTVPLNRGSYRVGSPFGMRNGRLHSGQDLPARTGTGVFAARAGRVSRAMTMRGSYGNHVFVDHGSGWQTRYAHLSSRSVSAGQIVGARSRIGAVGSTGNSTGPHLHFEIRQRGRALNPRSIMRFAKGGPIEGPGGPRDDMVPILASAGEFMHQTDAVRHYGKDFMHAVNDMRLPKLGMGGPVGRTVASSVPVSPAMSSTVTLDPSTLASALDGMSMTLEVDGHPMRGVVRTELNAHDRAVNRAVRAGAMRTAIR